MLSWNWVTRRLATGGGIASDADVQLLLAGGIDTIVDCCAANDEALLGKLPTIQYLWNPTADDGQHPKPAAWFGRSLDFVLPLLAKPKHRMYIHCSAGVNRGPSTLFAVLLAIGLPPKVAEAMIRNARPQVGLAYKQDAIGAVSMLGYW
jgi:hypothetical protein